MKIIKTFFDKVKLIELNVFEDDRGLSYEIFSQKKLKNLNIIFSCKQTYTSINKKNVFRGCHYNSNLNSKKIILVKQGMIEDYVCDIRIKSKTFGQVRKIKLSNNARILYIPAGFAHSFVSLQSKTEVFYYLNYLYNTKFERGFSYKYINIFKFLKSKKILLSDRDKKLRKFEELFDYSKVRNK